jgi:hypothetical protein
LVLSEYVPAKGSPIYIHSRTSERIFLLHIR